MESWKEIVILIALTFLLVLFTLYTKNPGYQIFFLLVGFIILFGAEIWYFATFQKILVYPTQLIIIVILTTVFVTGYKYFHEEK